MAKFVCDFASVTAAGEKLCSVASDLTTAVDNYSSQIESDLSGWDGGEAKPAFTSSCTTQVEAAKADAQYINSLGEFVKNVSSSIEALEGELAGLHI